MTSESIKYGTHHASHDALPALEYLPLVQKEHWSLPASLLYLPASHGLHDPSLASDRTSPGTQRTVGAAVGLGVFTSEGASHTQ